MSQATFSVRMDDTLKSQFETLCNDFGMNMSTAINVFARAVVRERKIPFEIASASSNSFLDGCRFQNSTADAIDDSRQNAMRAFMAIRDESANNFSDGLELDEINQEIAAARKEMRKSAKSRKIAHR